MTPDLLSHITGQHMAFVGRTGSGKTYAAKGIVEHLLTARRRVCIIDPTGAWWGVRSSADGKHPGFPVAVFGGEHADVPIVAGSGAALAELIATRNMPAVIDLSEFLIGDRHRFMEDFAGTLYRANRTPLHLIIDEADEFAPQNPLPETKRMLHQVDRIVRRGRIRGFRVMLITQRPAVLHKNVLTQANTLIAMRLTAPQDRKAIEDWIKGQADLQQGKDVLNSLARLQRGEGWVWAPEQDVLRKEQFPRIRTFDSSRTPEDGEQIEAPTKLADVDLDAIRGSLAEAEEDAKANDPKALRTRVRELEQQLADGGSTMDDIDVARGEGFEAGKAEGLRLRSESVQTLLNALGDARANMHEQLGAVEQMVETWRQSHPEKPDNSLRLIRNDIRPASTENHRDIPHNRQVAKVVNSSPAATGASPSVRKILDVIHAAHPVGLTFAAASARAVISRRSSAYSGYERAVIASPEVTLENGKFRSAPGFAKPIERVSGDPVETWAARLPPSYGAMLRAIAKGPASGLDRLTIATRASVSPTSSGLTAGLRELCELALVESESDRYRLAEGLRR